MTEPDEETKEHPAYGDPDALNAAVPGPALPPAAFPGDPLQPTTLNTIRPAPAGMAPINPAMPPAPPAYPQTPASPQTPAYPQPPASGWPGQSQWQQPGYGAPPTSGQSAYGAAPGYAAAQTWAGSGPIYKTSFLVALAGLVLIIFGLAAAVLGAWALTLGSDLGRFIRDNDIAIFGRQIERDTLKAIVQPMPGILMVLGLLQLLVGAVILAHRNWARWLGILLALLGLIVSVIALSAVLALVPGVSVQLIVASTLVIGHAFVLLALIAGGGHFRAQYPRAR
ncbi:MAG: hypothetical protein QFC55_08395 [Chloroflexota bacterium]|nr:hypothetical protein [Chloroflexota bacterium]